MLCVCVSVGVSVSVFVCMCVCACQTVLCASHCPPKPDQDTVLSSLSVFRRVYINRDENKQVARYDTTSL